MRELFRWVVFFAVAFMFYSVVLAETITVGPEQVSDISVNGTTFTWDANPEPDVGGYIACWSFDSDRSRAFVLVDNQCVDLGNVLIWNASTDPDLDFDRPDGSELDFGFICYDKAGGDNETYELTDNRSEIQTQLAAGGSASINFTQDAPPAKMGGVGLQ